jgi:glucokinase
MSLIGAIDIGGTKIAVGAVRADGTIAYRCEAPTDASAGFEDAMLRVRRMLHETVDVCGNIDGIGVGCPGPLDPFTGVIGEVGTLPGWKGGDLIEKLETEFRVSVAVENDADAAALAEYKWGTGCGAENFIYITISTGIGGGIILGGRLYRGGGGAHPEIGHQIIDNAGPLCYCGARGCWESLASGTAMSEWIREVAPERGACTAAEICALAANGDEVAIRGTRRESHYLGLGLANVVTLFAPDAVALGGGVMKSSALLLDDAIHVVQKLCTQVPLEKIRIVLSSLGPEVGLLGASEAWTRRYR